MIVLMIAQVNGASSIAVACKNRQFDIAVMLAKHGAAVDAVSTAFICAGGQLWSSLLPRLKVHWALPTHSHCAPPCLETLQELTTTLREHCSSL
jgi:hypothetical protein